MKLNQIIAVEKGVRGRGVERLTGVYKTLQRQDAFTGHQRRYVPMNDDVATPQGEMLPPDTRNIQEDVHLLLQQVAEASSEIIDVTWQRDLTNCVAKADVVVDGNVLIKGAPVPFLLSLEKYLNDIHSEVKKIPTLDASEKWTFDLQQGCWVSEVTETTRTKKVTNVLVLHPATKEHPAQVKEVSDDVRVGTWRTTKQAKSVPATVKAAYLSRVETLQKAVKFAREEANQTNVVEDKGPGKALFEYLFPT